MNMQDALDQWCFDSLTALQAGSRAVKVSVRWVGDEVEAVGLTADGEPVVRSLFTPPVEPLGVRDKFLAAVEKLCTIGTAHVERQITEGCANGTA